MSLTEQRVVKQITVLPNQPAVNVQWSNQILRDTEVISEKFERKSYTVEQKEEFLSEVDGASSYVSILGWDVLS